MQPSPYQQAGVPLGSAALNTATTQETRLEKNAQVTKKVVLTDFLFRIWLRPDAKMTGFKAGQFVNIGLPGDGPDAKPIKRSYSLASGENESDLELYVRLVPEGALTPRLLKLAVGDRLWMDPRFLGHFTLDATKQQAAKELVLIGSGTGLAPFIAMLRSECAKARYERIVVLHGVRLPEELSYTEELEGYCRQDGKPKVVYLPSCTRPRPEDKWTGATGRIPSLFDSGLVQECLGGPLDPQRQHFLLCGNPDMIVAMEEWLVAHGHKKHKKSDPGNVHSERYW
jgi:ferredoxin--NADP+ reductase